MNTSIQELSPADIATAGLPQEYLTFMLGREEYGVDILSVQEIRSYEKPTRMVQAPVSVLGVINLRGEIVPVIDLRARLGFPACGADNCTATIILNVQGHTVGIAVDSVSDVVHLGPQQLHPVPNISSPVGQHMLAVGALEHRMLILLNIAQCLRAPEAQPGSAAPV